MQLFAFKCLEKTELTQLLFWLREGLYGAEKKKEIALLGVICIALKD